MQGAVKEPKVRPSAVGECGDCAQQGQEKRRQKKCQRRGWDLREVAKECAE